MYSSTRRPSTGPGNKGRGRLCGGWRDVSSYQELCAKGRMAYYHLHLRDEKLFSGGGNSLSLSHSHALYNALRPSRRPNVRTSRRPPIDRACGSRGSYAIQVEQRRTTQAAGVVFGEKFDGEKETIRPCRQDCPLSLLVTAGILLSVLSRNNPSAVER